MGATSLVNVGAFSVGGTRGSRGAACSVATIAAPPSHVPTARTRTVRTPANLMAAPLLDDGPGNSTLSAVRRQRNPLPTVRSVGLDAEGQEHVPRAAAEGAVAGVHVQHAARDGWTRAQHRRAFARAAVQRLELTIRVVRPDDRAVPRRVRAKRAVHRSRENDPGNDGDGGRL